MFSFRAWLGRISLLFSAASRRTTRVRRGRRGGLWFSRNRAPKRLRARDMYRESASWPFERLEPIALLTSDNWIGGASGDWNVGTNWSNGVPGSGADVTITPVSGSINVTLTATSNSIH